MSLKFGTVVVGVSADRRKRACYVEVDGKKVADLPIESAERFVDASGEDTTRLSFLHAVRWEERE